MQTGVGRLLVIDDEPSIAKLISNAAQDIGYDTKALTDPTGFEAIVQQWQPTVVMLDIVMPDRDGLELIGVLAAMGYDGSVVIMSGAEPLYAQMAGTAARVRGLRLAKVVFKPVRLAELHSLFRTLAEIED